MPFAKHYFKLGMREHYNSYFWQNFNADDLRLEDVVFKQTEIQQETFWVYYCLFICTTDNDYRAPLFKQISDIWLKK